MPRERGRFIVLDGPDGCGKSTQARWLVRFLAGMGIRARAVKDPGTTAVGKKLRGILLSLRSRGLAAAPELFLYLAARAQLVAEVIRPSLERGEWVVSDRYSASTVAYQGHGPGHPPRRIALVADLCRVAEDGVEPDLTVLLDLPAEAGLARIRRARDRMESRPLPYHRRVRTGFLAQAAKDARFAVLDAREDPDTLHLKIQALAAPLYVPTAKTQRTRRRKAFR